MRTLLILFLSFTVINIYAKNNCLQQDNSLLHDTIHFPGETHFKNVRQLTFGGDNAEAYFSFDGKYLIFQKTNPKEGIQCDQIWNVGKTYIVLSS